MRNFLKEIKTTLLVPPVAAGVATTGASTGVLDQAGFDSVSLTAILGTHGSTAVTTLRAQGATSSTMTTTGWTSLGSAAVSSTKGVDDKFLQVDVIRPKFRFIRALFARSSSAGGSEFGGILAHQYGAKHLPVSQSTATRASSGVLALTT